MTKKQTEEWMPIEDFPEYAERFAADIRSMAASLLSQDEVKGERSGE